MTLNLNTIQKNYDKLTAQERFALTYAARVRGDELEARALLDSAPEVTITFPNTRGIHEGFRDLANIHRQTMLSAAIMFWMTNYWEDGETDQKIIDGGRTLAAKNYLESKQAFKTVCEEYKIDPAPLEETIELIDVSLALMETIIDQAQLFAPIELTSLEEVTAAYREVIERARKDCYEDKAK